MTTLLVDAVVRSSVVLLVGLAAVAVLRRRSAALRHWLLASTIVAAALATPLAMVLPEWSFAALPAAARGAAVPAHAGGGPSSPAVTGVRPASSSRVPEATPQPARSFSIGAIWAMGAGVGLLAMLMQLRRLRQITAGAPRITDARWLSAAAEAAATYRIRRPVLLVQGASRDLLATWGWLRPRILLPAQAGRWSDERIRVVVRHELAHVRRNDWALLIAADLLRRLYWFQPLMWIACRQLRRESEHACDDEVLRTGVEPHTYARHLLQIARAGLSDYTWAPVMPMARPSTLERRVAAMLNTARNRHALSQRSLIVCTAALAAITLTAAAVHTAPPQGSQLIGTIYDGSGAVLPGVPVTLTDDQNRKVEATTDAAGRFQLAAKGDTKYVLEASMPGFTPFKQPLELKTSGDWDRVITLQLGTLQESVSVRAKREPATQPVPGTPKPTPVRVGGNIKAPTKLLNVNPVYPPSMRSAGRGGLVQLDAIISTDGSVVFARVVSGNVHPDFVDAALEAVRQWKFSPTLLNGKPVEVVMGVTVNFSLE